METLRTPESKTTPKVVYQESPDGQITTPVKCECGQGELNSICIYENHIFNQISLIGNKVQRMNSFFPVNPQDKFHNKISLCLKGIIPPWYK